MKKKLVLILCLALSISMLAACGNSNSSTDTSSDAASETATEAETSSDSSGLSSTDGSDANGVAPDEEFDAAELIAAAGVTEGIDIDLTVLSSTMKYSQVYNMVTMPDEFIGKTVKMEGQFAEFTDDTTGNQYFACLIADVAACCSQGIEFVPQGEMNYPDDFPELGSDIVVTGTFDTYTEGSAMYCTLTDATILS